ncbi:g12360 [Coccomyxa viridis]|uniref:G12360 protein n=1 Tax=Coccomyxa viridis TaxID=1274662 RepID=A0ABP1GEF1_9CHLO
MSAALKGSIAAGQGARFSGAHVLPRKAFSGQAVSMSLPRKQLSRRGALVVRAFEDEEEEPREWPYPKYVQEVRESFPEKAVANVEEARVLYSSEGYTYLDVRPKLENEEVGRVRNSVNIPMVNLRRVWDPEQKKKVLQKEDNEHFIDQVLKRFPDKDATILVACSNGKKYSLDALGALDEEGYTHIVGLKGGYNAWFRVFDNKLNRRRWGEYAENYTHGADSCGIHASGAGFERSDRIESWSPTPLEFEEI